jgi:ankyrin repeat protein
MAMDELKIIGEELLSSLNHNESRDYRVESLDAILLSYEKLLELLQGETKRFSRSSGDIVLTASMKLARNQLSYSYEANESGVIAQYSNKGHHGMSYVLMMKRLMRDDKPHYEEKTQFLKYREAFAEDVITLLEESDLLFDTNEDIGFNQEFDLCETQLFVPRVLCRIPSVLSAMYEDGRKDCLLRSVRLIAYDADAKLPYANFNDDMSTDILGRTALHQAVLSYDLDFIDRMEPKPSGIDIKALGLTALHMTVIGGNFVLFKLLLQKSSRDCLHVRATYKLWNCLHWAVAFGRLGMIQELCSFAGPEFGKYINEQGWAGCTSLHLAAESGHVQILCILLDHFDQNSVEYDLYQTPFWKATVRGRLNILKLLEPFFDVDKPNYAGKFTPLAVAALNGYTDCVQYLLSLNESGRIRVNVNFQSHKFSGTPLDLAIENCSTDCIRLIKANGGLTMAELLEPKLAREGNPM